MVREKTNLYLLTGFLGAGKTTLLTNILEDLSGEKVGVIMNEFGKVGVLTVISSERWDRTCRAKQGIDILLLFEDILCSSHDGDGRSGSEIFIC